MPEMSPPNTVTNLVIKEFLDGLDPSETWRVDWLGDVRRRQGRMAQHHIQVHLSPLHKPFTGWITSSGAIDQDRQRMVELGVGYLPILHLGATFRAGRPVQQSSRVFRRLRIPMELEPTSQQYLSFDCKATRFEEKPPVSLVYPSEYSAGRRAWRSASQSQVLALSDVGRVDSCYVLIPCIEVIRFFFCPSSTLATHLFANAWDSLIWEKGSHTDRLPQEITVGTNTVKGVRATDARHLAFMLANPRTRLAVQSVHQALQSTRQGNSLGGTFKCPFPFDEPTRIEADVVEINTGTSLGKRYFVTRLHRCERPIPFGLCYWNPMLNPNQGNNGDSPDLLPMSIGPSYDETDQVPEGGRVAVPRNLDEVRASGLTGDDLGNPGGYIEEVDHWVDGDRFPGLREVQVILAPKNEQTHRYDPSKKRPLPVDIVQASTATADRGGSPVLAALIQTDQGGPEQSSLADPFIKLLHASAVSLTNRLYGVTVLPLQRLQPSRQSRSQRNWSTIWTPEWAQGVGRRGRRRVLACLVITLHEHTIVVADIERRRGVASEESFALAGFLVAAHISTNTFVQALTYLVSERQGWPQSDARADQPWIAMRRTSHRTGDSAEQLAQRIESLLITPLLMNAP